MGKLSKRHDNNIRVHFQDAYLRVRGEWNRLRTVSKGRWQCNMLNLQVVTVWQKVLFGGGGGSYSTAAYVGM